MVAVLEALGGAEAAQCGGSSVGTAVEVDGAKITWLNYNFFYERMWLCDCDLLCYICMIVTKKTSGNENGNDNFRQDWDRTWQTPFCSFPFSIDCSLRLLLKYESLSTLSLVVVMTLFSSDATKLRFLMEQVEPKNTFNGWKMIK